MQVLTFRPVGLRVKTKCIGAMLSRLGWDTEHGGDVFSPDALWNPTSVILPTFSHSSEAEKELQSSVMVYVHYKPFNQSKLWTMHGCMTLLIDAGRVLGLVPICVRHRGVRWQFFQHDPGESLDDFPSDVPKTNTHCSFNVPQLCFVNNEGMFY